MNETPAFSRHIVPPYPLHLAAFITIFLWKLVLYGLHWIVPIKWLLSEPGESFKSVPRPPPGASRFAGGHGECGRFWRARRIGNASEAGEAGMPDTVMYTTYFLFRLACMNPAMTRVTRGLEDQFPLKFRYCIFRVELLVLGSRGGYAYIFGHVFGHRW